MTVEDKIHKKILENMIYRELDNISLILNRRDITIDFSHPLEERQHEKFNSIWEYTIKVNNHSNEYYYISNLSCNVKKLKKLFDEINKYYENRR